MLLSILIQPAKVYTPDFSTLEKSPTLDQNGRYHAPNNFYEYEGKTYMAGEYLHIEGLEEFNNTNQPTKTRVKIALSDLPKIQSLACFEGNGKSWNQFDIAVCYVYLNVTKAQKEQINKLIPNKKELILAENAKDTDKVGVTFKFQNRIVSNILRKWNYTETSEFELWDKCYYPLLEWTFDKKDKVVTNLHNKMVCYRYNNDIIKVE